MMFKQMEARQEKMELEPEALKRTWIKMRGTRHDCF